MATQAQVDANRLNAQQSTGPQTDAGKAASSQNAYRHGLRSTSAVAPGEDPAEYLAFAQAVLAELDPAGISQRILAERIAFLQWKLQRIPAIEQMTLNGTKEFLRDNARRRNDYFPVHPSASLLIANNLDGMIKLQTYELRLQRSLQQAQGQYAEMKRQAREAKQQSAPAPAKPKEPPSAASPEPVAPVGGDNSPPGQTLGENRVRSAGSPQVGVPPLSPPVSPARQEVGA